MISTGRGIRIGLLAAKEDGAFKIGPFGSSLRKSELVSSGIPVVGIENVLSNQFIKGWRRYITPAKFKSLSDYEIRPGDVLVTTMGTIGRAAVAPPDLGQAIIDSHLFRMRVDREQVYPAYLCLALNSGLVASQLSQMAHGAIMDGLNTTILRECVIPLPSLTAQERIVALLELADRLRARQREGLRQAEHLFQSLVHQTFQMPDDRSTELMRSTKPDGSADAGSPGLSTKVNFDGSSP